MSKPRITAERKRELLDRCNSLRPLTQKQTEWCLKDTAKYIWFHDHDTEHGHCERCGHDVTFESKTRHAKEVLCPHCKQKMTIRHKWRVKRTYSVNFRAITKVTAGDEYLLRYVRIQQSGEQRNIREVAREIVNLTEQKRYEFENTGNAWDFGNKQKWFTERFMYVFRNDCVLQAYPYIPGMNAELRKLNKVKYLADPMSYDNKAWYVTAFIRELYKRADLYEKLEKVGMSDIAHKDFKENTGSWRPRVIKYDPTQTSLSKMLGVNKANMRRFLASRDTVALSWMQICEDLTDKDIELIKAAKISDYDFNRIKELEVGRPVKILRYCMSHNVNAHEYCQYVDTMKRLEYQLDDSYLYPKDFRKADNRVSEEWDRKLDPERIKKYEKQSALIKKISDGLKAMPDLAEFMDGSKGLLVYVPDCAIDLIREGRAQHNCIGSYVDRVAENKTFVFFVRKLEAPNEPFVSFEYANGEVIQCRSDHNEKVSDTKIIDFVDAFSERLRKNKVLCA